MSGANGPLRAGNDVVALPRKALSVLWLLAGRAGEVISKDELLSAVWPRRVVTEGVVAACLRDLRRALGDDPKRPRFIATAHGIGYRFVAAVEHAVRSAGACAAPTDAAGATPVGRELELAQLGHAFAKALTGQRQLVFVSGEAGIGKSALVDSFIAQLPQVRVARGQCSETFGGGEAYMPVLEAFDRLCRQPGGQAVTALLRRHAPTWLLQLPALLDDAEVAALRLKVAGSAVERMRREMVEAVAAIAAHEPLVLLIEDLHWCDRSTVEWLSLLARRREAARLLVVLTCRPQELIAGQHPLKPLKQELVARGLAVELSLGRLPAEAVQAYLERRLPGRAAELGAPLFRQSQGHPLFMVHLADDLEHRPAALGDTPGSLHELIEAQLARLEAHQQLALEAASVAGTEFAAASIAAALHLDPEQTEALLDALAAHEQFVEHGGLDEWHDGTVSGRYAFRHELYRETLYRRLGAARRVRWHLRIGERLAEGWAAHAAEIASELALHFAEAKDRRAAQYCREAGETAFSRHACRETLAHVEQGLALLRSHPAGPDSERTEMLLHLTQGAALLATRGFGAPEVGAAYLRAQTLSLRLRDIDALVPALSGLWNHYLTRAEFAQADRVVDQMFDIAQDTPNDVVQMLAHHFRGVGLLFAGHAEAAVSHLDRGAALYARGEHRHRLLEFGEDIGVVGHKVASLTHWVLGRTQKAWQQIDQGHALARALAHPFSEAQVLWMDAVIALDGHELQRLHSSTEQLVALCVEHDFPLWLAGGRILRGAALALRGRHDEGLLEADRGLQAWRASGTRLMLPHALSVVSMVHALHGRDAAAKKMLHEALECTQRTGEGWLEPELHRLLGELLRRQGTHGPARAAFQRALSLARQHRLPRFEQRAAAGLAQLEPLSPA